MEKICDKVVNRFGFEHPITLIVFRVYGAIHSLRLA